MVAQQSLVLFIKLMTQRKGEQGKGRKRWRNLFSRPSFSLSSCSLSSSLHSFLVAVPQKRGRDRAWSTLTNARASGKIRIRQPCTFGQLSYLIVTLMPEPADLDWAPDRFAPNHWLLQVLQQQPCNAFMACSRLYAGSILVTCRLAQKRNVLARRRCNLMDA